MKKILAVLTAVCLLFSLCGCHFGAYYIKQEGIKTNYNNIHSNHSLWITERAVFYKEVPFFVPRAVCLTGKSRKELGKLERDGRVQIDGSTAYLINAIHPKADDSDDDSIFVCIYHLANNSKEWVEISGVENNDYDIGMALVLGDTLLFSMEPNYYLDENDLTPLYALSLETGALTKISDEIADGSLGVVDGVPIYAVEYEDAYWLYTYDVQQNLSVYAGTLAHEDFVPSNWDAFNYVSGKVILHPARYFGEGEEAKGAVLIYDLAKQEIVTEHRVDDDLFDFIACENYAFFNKSIYKTDGNFSSFERDIVYRLSLSDGTCEEVAAFEDFTELFVTSDEFVYVETDEYIYRCDMDGNKEIVCKF